MASAAKAFQGQLLHVSDQVSSGTAGQTLTAATWNTRNLQTTVTNEITSASLASNVISLPAGTYYVEAQGTSYNSGLFNQGAKLRLRNTTDGSTLLNGTSQYFTFSGSGTASSNQLMNLAGRFTLSGTKSIELQHWVTSASNLSGHAATSGEVEVYANVMIWKVA